MFIATYESRNFEFTALGEEESDAVSALIRGLTHHGKKHNLSPSWWGSEEGFRIKEIRINDCLRDFDSLHVS